MLDRTEKASSQDHEVYWPDVTLAENEREGQRTENYTINFVDKEGQAHNQSFDYEQWLTYKPEGKYLASVDFFGEVVEVKPGG